MLRQQDFVHPAPEDDRAAVEETCFDFGPSLAKFCACFSLKLAGRRSGGRIDLPSRRLSVWFAFSSWVIFLLVEELGNRRYAGIRAAFWPGRDFGSGRVPSSADAVS